MIGMPVVKRKINPRQKKDDKPTRRIPLRPLEIMVCTPDVMSDCAQLCLRTLKETTAHIACKITVADNHGQQPFSHPAAINAALDRAEGYLVIADDDVEFLPGWLDSALDIVEVDDSVSVVGFTLMRSAHALWGTGIWSKGRDDIHVCQTTCAQPVYVPSQCSACYLMVPNESRMDERYKKYRFEVDYCLRQWENGRRVIVSPQRLIHRNGTQFRANCPSPTDRAAMVCFDTSLYRKDWIKTGREERVIRENLHTFPFSIRREIETSTGIGNEVKTAAEVQRKERRAVVVVAVGEDYKKTLRFHARYARACNADLIVVDETWMFRVGMQPHYLKWKCNAVIEMGYDRVCFMDGDTLPLPGAPDIFDATVPGTLGVFDEAPVVAEWDMDRRADCIRWYKAFVAKGGKIVDYKYPGRYFNSGVMVFDRASNPFRLVGGNICTLHTDSLFDQTQLNVLNAGVPKTWLDWRYNRMAIEQFGKHYGLTDMMQDGPHILHFCGNASHKRLYDGVIQRIAPPAVERKPGPSLQGLYDMCAHIGPDVSHVLEIGSAHGESAEVFADMWPRANIVCVDPWDTARYGAQAEKDWDVRHGRNKHISKVREQSLFLADHMDASSMYDFIYIDAMHEYEHVLADIRAWLPHVRKGGWICGHDYNRTLWPGVIRAVHEVFGGADMVFQDTSWIVKI